LARKLSDPGAPAIARCVSAELMPPPRCENHSDLRVVILPVRGNRWWLKVILGKEAPPGRNRRGGAAANAVVHRPGRGMTAQIVTTHVHALLHCPQKKSSAL
jgi:hypothetical protein